MIKLIKKFRKLTFKERTIFSTLISIYLNGFLAVCKYIMAFFGSAFFLAAGTVNVLVMGSKLQCYLGEKYPKKKSFEYRNKMIGILLLFAGLEYSIYMARLIFFDSPLMKFDMFLGICVAFVSFIEMGLAIYGCFASYGKGHYYRNIKLISFCSAMTAIVLTEIAIMSFASEIDFRFLSGIFGVGVGLIIILIAIFVLIAPKISIVDRDHNQYLLWEGFAPINEEKIEIKLTNSKFYGNYKYIGKKIGDVIDGRIIQEKSPIFKWNIYIKILVIVLSEILIFPYAIGGLVYYFKNAKLIKKLDQIMLEKGYEKVK